MSTLVSTDIAAVSTGDRIYVYFQEGTSIHEFHSDDGVKWTAGQNLADKKLSENGSPITAYFVKYDGSHGNKPSIHVFYLDKQNHLCGEVRDVADDKWTALELPKEIVAAPVSTSRLASAVCHDDESTKSHQWVYFTEENKDKGLTETAEIRSGPDDWSWVYRKVLPDKGKAALPGTSMAVDMTNPTTHLFFQDHEGNILMYNGSFESWDDWKVLVAKGSEIVNTPLATCKASGDDKFHIFFTANDGSGHLAVHDFVDGKNVKVATYAPGSRLGAADLKDSAYLFYKEATAPLAISSMVYKSGSWSAGAKVVA